MSRNEQPPPSPDELAANLFGVQHGAAADRQLRAAGFSWGRQQRMIANNRWRREAPGVVFLVGAPQTWHQRAMAATLYWKGLCLLSGASAARLHGFDGFANVDTVQIALPYGGYDKTPDSVSVRWARRLSKADRYVVDGIPVTTQPVTLIHLHADGLPAEKALDSVLRRRKPPLWLSSWSVSNARASSTTPHPPTSPATFVAEPRFAGSLGHRRAVVDRPRPDGRGARRRQRLLRQAAKVAHVS
jgi:hypothetical protein